MASNLSTIILLLLCSSIISLGLELKSEKELDDSNFHDYIKENEFSFIKFYSPTCGWCRRLAPTWTKLSHTLNGIINIASIDVSKYKEIGREYRISGVPTLLLFNKSDLKNYKTYSGDRSEPDFVQFVLNELPILNMSYDQAEMYFDSNVDSPIRLAYLYMNEDEKFSNYFNILYQKLKSKASLAKIKVSNDDLNHALTTFGVNELPVIVTIQKKEKFVVMDNTNIYNLEKLSLKESDLIEDVEKQWKRLSDSQPWLTQEKFTIIFFVVSIGVIVSLYAVKKIMVPKTDQYKSK